MKQVKPEQVKTNHAITKIQKTLSASERDYWWRLAHNLISIKSIESKWRRDKDDKLVSNTCPACEKCKEDRRHYNFECESIQRLIDETEAVYTDWTEKRQTESEKWRRPTEDDWNLQAENMNTEMMIVIAKARWIWHLERCQVELKKKRRMNLDLIVQRLKRELERLDEGRDDIK